MREPWRSGDSPAATGTALLPRPWLPGETPPRPTGGLEPSLWLIDRRWPAVRAVLPGLAGLLTPDERTRYRAYRLQEDRERFLLGRAALRQLLGSWLAMDPSSLPLGQGEHGKPELRLESPGEGLEFNVAHSGDLVVLAFHPCCPVGVDVEQSRPHLAWQPIARRVLPPATQAWLEQLPEQERGEAFLLQWCLLEATLKSRGTGFASHGAETPDRWPPPTSWTLELPPGYCGAVSLLVPEHAGNGALPA